MTADPSEKSAKAPEWHAGFADAPKELPPIDVTLEPIHITLERHAYTPPIRCSECNEPWHQGSCSSPLISPVPVKTRAELLAEIASLKEELESHAFALSTAMVQARNDQLNAEIDSMRKANLAISESLQAEIDRRGRKLDTLILAAESIESCCPKYSNDPPADELITVRPLFRQILALRSAIANAK